MEIAIYYLNDPKIYGFDTNLVHFEQLFTSLLFFIVLMGSEYEQHWECHHSKNLFENYCFNINISLLLLLFMPHPFILSRRGRKWSHTYCTNLSSELVMYIKSVWNFSSVSQLYWNMYTHIQIYTHNPE